MKELKPNYNKLWSISVLENKIKTYITYNKTYNTFCVGLSEPFYSTFIVFISFIDKTNKNNKYSVYELKLIVTLSIF